MDRTLPYQKGATSSIAAIQASIYDLKLAANALCIDQTPKQINVDTK